MKTRIYIISLLLCFAFLQKVSARNYYKGEADYEKVLVKDKTFDFSFEKTLKIRNQQGSVTIKNWDKPQISITVKLSANIKSKSKLNKLLEHSEVLIANDNWSFESKCFERIRLKNEFYSFDYTIYAPKNIKVDLQTTFGEIQIESINNDSRIKGKFVEFQLNKVVGEGQKPLQIALEFADDGYIGTVQNLDIKTKFSTVEINSVAELELNAKFSTIEINEVDKIEVNTQFSKVDIAGETASAVVNSKQDKLNWEIVEDIEAEELEFTSLKIEKLLKNLVLESVRFGKIRVEGVAEDFEYIDIDSEFTPIRIDAEDLHYDFDFSTTFGKIKFDEENATIKEKVKKMSSLKIKGVKQGKGKKGRIKIRNKQGNITIK